MKFTHATAEATSEYAARFKDIPYNSFADTELKISAAGFGSYRIDVSYPEHRAALQKALLSGINLIDTSTNYTGGGSELLIGSVLDDLEAEAILGRNQIVIISKVGYLQGREYRLSQNLKRDGRGYPDLVEYAPNLEHCIHPDFIKDQLTRSLSRLNCGAIDSYLLHNPEYFLMWAKHEGWELEQAREEYYRRIKLAFEYLETETQRGRIRSYGVSSNTLPVKSSEYDYTSLEKLLEIASSINPLNNFKVVQFPFNLIESGAAVNETQTGEMTMLELARRHKLCVLVNRPLNTIYLNKLIRLSDENPNAEEIMSVVREVSPEWGKAETLSQMAVRALRSTLGVSSVLVGMRDLKYVRDIELELHRAVIPADRSEEWKTLRRRLRD